MNKITAILECRDFIEKNRAAIMARLEAEAANEGWEPAALLPHVRPLVDGIIFLGSTPDDYRAALTEVSCRFPDAPAVQTLALLVLEELIDDAQRV